MSDINELKDTVNLKTPYFVLFSIITCGIYLILWLQRNYPVIDRITGQKTADAKYILWLAIGLGCTLVLAEPPDNFILFLIVALLQLNYWILTIFWSFKARSALQAYALVTHKIDLRMNVVWTFLFHFFYINYCINDLAEVKRKQDILFGKISGMNPGTQNNPEQEMPQ
ncbi:DUF4234 domain-containing protein [Desulfococcaceae bacterium OttesenSCG-928-F15]|nr:DUF4234 domain-containing protein [Desulfococcaceae bacterium OttesenSCG-928-F15]